MWATVSSQSCFCWLYRASPSLAAKNIINLILVLTIRWCRVFSCVVGRGCLLWPAPSFGKTLLAFVLLHFVLQGQTWPVTPGISWLPTFAFQYPIMKRTSFWSVSSRRSCRSSYLGSDFSFFSISGWGMDLDYYHIAGLPWKWTEIILSFLRLHPSTAFWTLLLTMRAPPFLLRDSCPH